MSASIVARRICATPVRSASEVWQLITTLVTNGDESARPELDRVSGIGMAVIAAEALRTSPLIVSGVGPQLRVYCLYDEEAIVGQDASEDPLSWNPTDGDWVMSLPCPPEDLDWVTTELTRATDRITARDLTDSFSPTKQADKRSSQQLGPINVEAFRQR